MRLPILAATTLAVTAVITLAPTATRAETITGTFRYHDGDGDLPPIADAVVEVWRFRPRALGVWSWGNDLTARTDLNGQLSATVPFVGAGVITTVRVFATNSHARVMTQDLPLTAFYQTPGSPTELQRTTVSAGDVLDFSFNFGSSFAQIHYNAAEAVRRGGTYVAARRDPAETDVLWPAVIQILTYGVDGYDQASDLIRLRPLTAMDDLSVLTITPSTSWRTSAATAWSWPGPQRAAARPTSGRSGGSRSRRTSPTPWPWPIPASSTGRPASA
jgi:hypothetical protein